MSHVYLFSHIKEQAQYIIWPNVVCKRQQNQAVLSQITVECVYVVDYDCMTSISSPFLSVELDNSWCAELVSLERGAGWTMTCQNSGCLHRFAVSSTNKWEITCRTVIDGILWSRRCFWVAASCIHIGLRNALKLSNFPSDFYAGPFLVHVCFVQNHQPRTMAYGLLENVGMELLPPPSPCSRVREIDHENILSSSMWSVNVNVLVFSCCISIKSVLVFNWVCSIFHPLTVTKSKTRNIPACFVGTAWHCVYNSILTGVLLLVCVIVYFESRWRSLYGLKLLLPVVANVL